MADTDAALKILISFGLDDAKAREALAAIEQIKGSTKGLAQETQGLGEKEEEASKFTEALHHNHRALHQIMHLLGKETVPELGHALTGALYGPIGIVIALGAGFEFLKKKLEEVKEAQDKLRESAEKFGQIAIDSAHKAQEEMADYEIKVESTKSAIDELKESETIRKSAIEETTKALGKLIEAQEKAALAAAQGDKDEQERIKRRFDSLKAINDLAGERAILDANESDLKNRTANSGSLLSGADSALANKASTQSQTALAAEAIQQELEERKKKQSELEKSFTQQFKMGGFAAQFINPNANEFTPPKSKEEIQLQVDAENKAREKAEKELKANESAINNLNTQIDLHMVASKQAAAASAEATRAYDDNKKAMDELTTEIRKQKQTLQIHTDSAHDIAIAGLTKGGADDIFSAAGKAISDYKTGKGTAQDKKAMEDLKSLLNTIGFNTQGVVNYLNKSGDLNDALHREILAAHKRIDEQQARINAIQSRN